jgi:addiction module HigA family antidote
MKRSQHPITPKTSIHPGKVLADELSELGLSPAALAKELNIPSNRIYQLTAGKRAMTADTALRLEQWLGVSAAFWMNLQKRYELDMATQTIGETIKTTIRRRDERVFQESLAGV